MRFSELVAALDAQPLGPGVADPEIVDVTRDSRRAGPGVLFVAVAGDRVDGHDFVADLPAGCAALVGRDTEVPAGVSVARVERPREALARSADLVFGRPSDTVPVVAVTGTNGKTTVAWWLAEAAAAVSGRPAGYVGTLGVRLGEDTRSTGLTTPEAPETQRTLRDLVDRDGVLMAMEASSIGLAQHRLDGVRVHTAVFTTLGRDHLDHHGSMAAYAASKALLFREAQLRSPGGAPRAILCADDPSWSSMHPPADRWTYGFSDDADIRIRRWSPGPGASVLELTGVAGDIRIDTSAIGRFNAANLTAAWAAGVAAGLEPEGLGAALGRVPLPRGRLARVEDPSGRLLLVDYAHTPDALVAALEAVREACPGSVHVVFGCGGDRDPGKRAPMGAVAADGADHVWITADNPRSEDPAEIAAEIARGAGQRARCIGDRADAIRAAVAAAGPGDAVLVAGKGHETEQVIGDRTLPFDDHEVLAAAVREGT